MHISTDSEGFDNPIIMSSFIYVRNVSTRGFEDMVVLPKSDHFDSITCSAIADLDLSGDNEIILGAYGQV